MFQIDLKKAYERSLKPTRGGSELADLAIAVAPVAAALVVLMVGLGIWGGRLDRANESLRDEVRRTEAQIEAQRQELAALTGRTRETILGAAASEIYWSDVLRLASERTPDKIWIAELVLVARKVEEGRRPERFLRIDGGVLSTSSESNLTEIGQFAKTLGADPRWREAFGEPTLGAVSRSEDPLTMRFSLTAPVGGTTS